MPFPLCKNPKVRFENSRFFYLDPPPKKNVLGKFLILLDLLGNFPKLYLVIIYEGFPVMCKYYFIHTWGDSEKTSLATWRAILQFLRQQSITLLGPAFENYVKGQGGGEDIFPTPWKMTSNHSIIPKSHIYHPIFKTTVRQSL